MKKLTFTILFLSALTLNACNNTSSAGDGEGNIPEGEVVHLTAANFKQLVWDYTKNPQEWSYKGDQPCIIDFYADWCRPCKMIAPIMVELSKEYKGKVRIFKINIDEQRELAKLFNVSSIPAVLFVPNKGKPQMAVGAMQKASYVEAIQQVLNVK